MFDSLSRNRDFENEKEKKLVLYFLIFLFDIHIMRNESYPLKSSQ